MTLHRSARREREPRRGRPRAAASSRARRTRSGRRRRRAAPARRRRASRRRGRCPPSRVYVIDVFGQPATSSANSSDARVRAESTTVTSVAAGGQRVADHRPQRHDPGAAADQQQRAALVGVPGERASAGPAQLELVALAQLAGQPRRDLAGVEVLDAELEGVVLGRRRDRVRPLGAVAVGRGQPDVDALARAVAFPAGHVEHDRPHARARPHARRRTVTVQPVQSP